MTPIRIRVRSAQGPYAVLVGAGLSRRLPDLLDRHHLPSPGVIVSVAPVWRRHGSRLRGLAAARSPVLIPDGERAKTLATTARLYDACAARGLDRRSLLLAFGGGVTGDVAGFAAASYLRGLRLVQVPTTLLAQVDSAVGGKVGVNLPRGKNLVGAFHPAALVVCDPELLRTLPAREFRAGLYEVVKYGVIASAPLFRRIETRLPDILARRTTVLTDLVARCCRIKARVVMADEHESGLRRVLNFGHTIGHALEAMTGYRRFRHGEAVAWGMLAAAHVSAARGRLPAAATDRLSALIRRIGPLPRVGDLRAHDALDVVGRDKKVVDGRLHFVLATRIGATAIAADVSRAELTGALRAIGLRA
ncbi:MAG: 3-dehydroquinate synthase [Vicinamibacterales bacterium]